MKRFVPILLMLASLLATDMASAGRSCDARKPSVQSITNGLSLAERTQQAFERDYRSSGSSVLILARAGQDLSKYGLRYSHLGLAYREPNGNWRVLHKLNHCGSADAFIYRQGLGEFYLDDPARYETAWVAASPALRDRLLPMLRDGNRALRLNVKPYSMVSYAWGRQYQQSNQWLLETLAWAMEPDANTRDTAQAWLKLKGYQPTVLRLGPLTRLGGRLTAANITFDDHPPDKRFSDQIATVTADSVFDWLQRSGLGGPMQSVRLP